MPNIGLELSLIDVRAPVQLRDFDVQDQAPVRALVLDGLGEHWGVVDPRFNPDLDDIAGSYASGRTVVATRNDLIVGTGSVVPREPGIAEVVRMSVRSDERGSGIGREVLTELVGTARAWGCKRVVLETASHWRDVVAFYGRCGFRITHEQEGEFCCDTWFELVL